MPVHYGDVAITDKTGGCKDDIGDVERTIAYKPALQGTWVIGEKRVVPSSHQY
jgi:hypothetical protein